MAEQTLAPQPAGPAPGVQPTMLQAPAAAAPNDVMPPQYSGTPSSPGFFDGVNWVEILFAVLGTAALCHVIYFYRQKVNQYNKVLHDHQVKIGQNRSDILQLQEYLDAA